MNLQCAPGSFRAALICVASLAALTPCFVRAQDGRPEPKDFSKSNFVTLLLVDVRRRNESPEQHGLSHAFWENDGRTTLMDVQGTPCRSLNVSEDGRPKGYFYFAIAPTFKEQDVSKVRIDVDYFDGFSGQEGVFGVQYDATGTANGSGLSSKQSLPNVPLKGSGKWLKATFHIKDATFQNAQNARSDFRLFVSPPELCVSRVTITLEPQAPNVEPLKFDPAGEAKLRDWNLQWDDGSKPTFTRGTNATDGIRWLEVRAPEPGAAGSWRTAVLLEPGEYLFVGKALTKDLAPGGGVALRASGRWGIRASSQAPYWTTLNYGFTMPALDYIELVCELRAASGSARFDLDSLKLIRREGRAKSP